MFSMLILLLLQGNFTALRLGAQGSFPKPLSAQEERRCLELAAAGDQAARGKLIEHNLRLVAHIVKKYYTQIGGDTDDLISIGTLGLIKAVNTYNMEKKIKLATYAARCIENAILSQMRLWFRTNPPRAEKNQNGVFWQRLPRTFTSFVPLRTAM